MRALRLATFALPLVLSLAVLAPALSCATPAAVNAPAPPPSLDPFYEPLAPWGDWWWSSRWGWVYSPRVGPGWRPYSLGRWEWTYDHGWLWVSEEPFGWATFHYGRWLWFRDAGWTWIPGRVWGPAWVAWRTGPGYIGWGPLPPGGSRYLDVAYGPWGWVMVQDRYFLSPRIAVVALPPARNPTVLPSTRVLHRPERARDDAAVARALDRERVERATGVPVTPRRIVEEPAQAGDERIFVPRAREVEARRGGPDLPGPRGVLTPGRITDERPLPAPTDEEIERDFAAQRERLREIHEAERRTPPRLQAPDELRRRQERELRDTDDGEIRERELSQKKRAAPKKVPKPAPAKEPRRERPKRG
jgi:hypothetical protein